MIICVLVLLWGLILCLVGWGLVGLLCFFGYGYCDFCDGCVV